MEKLFVPSVKCPICCPANDSDFRYCQRCGYKRKVICPSRVGQLGVNVDLTQIDKRLQQLLITTKRPATQSRRIPYKNSLRRSYQLSLGK